MIPRRLRSISLQHEELELRRLLVTTHVQHISVDGLASTWLAPMLETGKLPHLSRIIAEGASTLNARSDPGTARTTPTNFGLLSGRLFGPATVDEFPTTTHQVTNESKTVHEQQPTYEYLASVFDVVHDHGGTTALLSTKDYRLNNIVESYDATHGGRDGEEIGGDNGRQKIDKSYLSNTVDRVIIGRFTSQPSYFLSTYSFLHMSDVDITGHNFGFGSRSWTQAVEQWDQQLGQLLTLIDSHESLKNQTAIVITAPYGGKDQDHVNPQDIETSRVPMFVWGPDVPAGVDLYDLYSKTTTNPDDSLPGRLDPAQPIRSAHSANLALDLLGLPPIPGSPLTQLHRCATSVDGCPIRPSTADAYDWGDARQEHAVLRRDQGAFHRLDAAHYLGAGVTAEPDGQPALSAHEPADNDLDDGVEFLAPWVAGEPTSMIVTASQPGYLNVFLNTSDDKSYRDLTRGFRLSRGRNLVTLDIPEGTVTSHATVRFRYSTQPYLTPFGHALDGEVEDYSIEVIGGPASSARDDAYVIEASAISKLNVLANDRDVASIPKIIMKPEHGSAVVDGASGEIHYRPDSFYRGNDYFRYSIRDSRGVEHAAQVTLDVQPTTDRRVKFSWRIPAHMQENPAVQGTMRSLELVAEASDGSGLRAVWFDAPLDEELFDISKMQIVSRNPVALFTGGSFVDGVATDVGLESRLLEDDGQPLQVAFFTFVFRTPGTFTLDLLPSSNRNHPVRLFDGERIPVERWDIEPYTFSILPGYQNVSQPLDTSSDQTISPIDALLVINEINLNGSRNLYDVHATHWVDVNGDGWVTPMDALLVINWLNQPTNGELPLTLAVPAVSLNASSSDEVVAIDAVLATWLERETRKRGIKPLDSNHAPGLSRLDVVS